MKIGLTVILVLISFLKVDAKVYVDITSPGFKQLPTALYDFVGSEEGKKVSSIVRDDLFYSGVFDLIDTAAYVETPLPVFDPTNWLPLGIEIVIKGSVSVEEDILKATIYLYDVVEAKKLFQRKYKTKKLFLRSLAHKIANDIYNIITGQKGIFSTKIAFIVDEGKKQGIYIMDWDGKRIKKTGITGNIILSLHWSNDGNKLLYSSEKEKKWKIFLVDFKKRKTISIYSSSGLNIVGDFLASGNGFVFSSSVAGTPDIYIFKFKNKEIKRLTWRDGIEVSPSVSPDGSKIAYISDRTGTPQVYIMNIDGTETKRVTFTGRYNTSAVWSPIGDKLAYVGFLNGKNQIFIIKPDGSGLLQLTKKGNNEDPCFSPDGRFIVFTSDRDGKKRIYIMEANGKAQRALTPIYIKAFGPKWSPYKK